MKWNKTIIIVLLLLVLIISIVMIVKPNNKKEVILDDVKLKEEISKNDSIAIMLEQSDGTYKESNESMFPSNMLFNSEKSGCIDKEGQRIENSLTYSNGLITINTNKTSYCYVYFDRNDVVSISVTTPPNKTEYEPGENFDSTGMVVTATYIDGTAKEVTNYTVVNGSSLQEGQTSVIISYTEDVLTVTTAYEVVVAQGIPVIIEVGNHTDKTGYENYSYVTVHGETEQTISYDGSYGSAGKILELPIGTTIDIYAERAMGPFSNPHIVECPVFIYTETRNNSMVGTYVEVKIYREGDSCKLDGSYDFVFGTTWADWCGSSANTSGYYCDGDVVRHSNGRKLAYPFDITVAVKPTDLILPRYYSTMA